MTEAPEEKQYNVRSFICIKLESIQVSPVKLIFGTQVHESPEILWPDVHWCLSRVILANAVSFEHDITHLLNYY